MTAKTVGLIALLVLAMPSAAEVSPFAANEMRAAAMKDRVRNVRTTLAEGSEGARRHSAAITDAFRGADDWAPATENYYARKADLVARAAAIEASLDAVISRNSPERVHDVTKALDEASKKGDVLRSDYEFYMKLPRLGGGPQRAAAQAAMRLLAQTGDYSVSLAYFLSKTPDRPPFAPLRPGVLPIQRR